MRKPRLSPSCCSSGLAPGAPDTCARCPTISPYAAHVGPAHASRLAEGCSMSLCPAIQPRTSCTGKRIACSSPSASPMGLSSALDPARAAWRRHPRSSCASSSSFALRPQIVTAAVYCSTGLSATRSRGVANALQHVVLHSSGGASARAEPSSVRKALSLFTSQRAHAP